MTNLEIIEQLNNSDLIKKKYLDNGIVSYNFTRDTFYKQKWNELTCKARGLFIDSETGKIVARSYNKFFNEDQLTKEQLHEFEPPFDVSYKEKLHSVWRLSRFIAPYHKFDLLKYLSKN